MHFRLFRSLLLGTPVCLGLGCGSFGQEKQKPIGIGSPMLPPAPVALRSQKPDPPAPAEPNVGLPPVTLADGEVAVRAVAYVNNTPIFESELQEAVVLRLKDVAELQEPQRSRRLVELRTTELERLIEREVVLETATMRMKKLQPKFMDDLQREATKAADQRLKEIKDQMKIKSDEEFKRFLSQQGLTEPNFRRNIERGYIGMEFMRGTILPKIQHIPLSEIQAYYWNNRQEFTEQDRVKWQDIFIDASKFPDRTAARRYAEQAAMQLKAGGDFAKFAKELQKAGYNILPSDQGLGEKPGEIKPAELESTVFQLRSGQVGDPVEFPGGFHIVKVTKRDFAGMKLLDAETQNAIREKLLNLLLQKEYRRMVEDMKSKAIIQRMP
jgi:parvulin-like peptidyl-prolyl isomerase